MIDTRPYFGMRILFLLLIWGACLPTTQAGHVEYPALGHLRTEEGTIELWFTVQADPYPEIDAPYQVLFRLLGIESRGKFQLAVSWAHRQTDKGDRRGLQAPMRNEVGPRHGLLTLTHHNVEGWAVGQRHHVALVWKAHQMALYVDGQELVARTQDMSFPGDLGKATLHVGATRGDANVLVHAIRTSLIARSPQALAAAEPVPDIATLLLDLYDTEPVESGKTRHTSPRQQSDLIDRPAGTLQGKATYTDSPTPGLKL